VWLGNETVGAKDERCMNWIFLPSPIFAPLTPPEISTYLVFNTATLNTPQPHTHTLATAVMSHEQYEGLQFTEGDVMLKVPQCQVFLVCPCVVLCIVFNHLLHSQGLRLTITPAGDTRQAQSGQT
jgi:hypothetical protein